MLFRLLVSIGFAAVTLFLLVNYLRELWVFFTNRSEYDALKKPRIWAGEDGGPDVSWADRLIFSYPLFIGGFGASAIVLAHQVIVEFGAHPRAFP